ncbi:MAG: hypothetical protein NT150_01085, partial [Bacteroidetes bacterium]|nr:hypothetical protein [Bacteroidota bacterium]
MKHLFTLSVVFICVFLGKNANAACTVMPAEPVCSGTLIANNKNITAGTTTYSNGGVFTGVNLSGGTLILCSGTTTLTATLNAGAIYVKSGAVLNTAVSNIPSNCSLYNYGQVNFTTGLVLNNSTAFMNAVGATMAITGNFTGNGCTFVNYGDVTATGTLGNWQNSGGICMGDGATIEVSRVLWSSFDNWVSTPVGNSCLSYSVSASSSNGKSLSANAGTNICEKVGATDLSGTGSWGGSTLHKFCVACGNYCNSVGGAVSSNATVCSGSNIGTLTLSGHNGAVIRWESSTDGFLTSTSIANTTTSLTYTNLSATIQYRAVVQDGGCPEDNSASVTITVDPISVGGTVSADATVCSGSNAGTITVASYTGTITGWESSTDNFTTKTAIANVTASQSYLNLTATTKYRAIIKSGVC